MTDDIAFRLRHIYTMGQMNVVNEAADEIERLLAQNQEMQDAILHFEGRITHLQTEVKRLETEYARGV